MNKTLVRGASLRNGSGSFVTGSVLFKITITEAIIMAPEIKIRAGTQTTTLCVPALFSN